MPGFGIASNVKPDKYVRWDLAATLLPRLANADLVFDVQFENNPEFERILTLGFKLLSAIYEKGIKKEHIERLSSNKTINWDLDVDSHIQKISTMLKVLSEFSYFKFFKSWHVNIYRLLGDAIALNFIASLYAEWLKAGEPVGANQKTRQFQRYAYFLIDRFVYEHLKRIWRGSSDTRVTQNLTNAVLQQELQKPVESSKWTDLLKEAIDKCRIDDAVVSYKVFEAFLYHFYSTMEIEGPGGQTTIVEIDHIMPQKLFESNTSVSADPNKDNLCNLALLPKRDNISKKDKRLVEISDPWLKNQIDKFEFIDEPDYQKYSKLESMAALVTHRRPYFEKKFIDKRNELVR